MNRVVDHGLSLHLPTHVRVVGNVRSCQDFWMGCKALVVGIVRITYQYSATIGRDAGNVTTVEGRDHCVLVNNFGPRDRDEVNTAFRRREEVGTKQLVGSRIAAC